MPSKIVYRAYQLVMEKNAVVAGPLTEIPGSFWSGDADGMGWVLGDAQGPFTLQLTGLGGDYMAHVSVLGPDGPGGIEVRGTLAAGETRSVDVPAGAAVDTTNPTAVLSAPPSILVGQDLAVSGAGSIDRAEPSPATNGR